MRSLKCRPKLSEIVEQTLTREQYAKVDLDVKYPTSSQF